MRSILLLFPLLLTAQSPEAIWRAARSKQPAPETAPVLLQVSTLDALLRGLYAASYTVADLKQQGDFGVGTYEGLDGELIALMVACLIIGVAMSAPAVREKVQRNLVPLLETIFGICIQIVAFAMMLAPWRSRM